MQRSVECSTLLNWIMDVICVLRYIVKKGKGTRLFWHWLFQPWQRSRVVFYDSNQKNLEYGVKDDRLMM